MSTVVSICHPWGRKDVAGRWIGFLILAWAVGGVGPPTGQAAPVVIAREMFQGVGTLNAAQPGNLGTFVQGAWQKRAVGPRTSSIAAPGWSGDAQGTATESYWDVKNTYTAASIAGAVGVWVRFEDFGGGGTNNAASFLQTSLADGTPEYTVGVLADGTVLIHDSTIGSVNTGVALSRYTWYWFQIEWVNVAGSSTLRVSYHLLGGSLIQLRQGTNAAVESARVRNLVFNDPASTINRWRGRLGGASLYSIVALGDLVTPDNTLLDPPTGPFHWQVNPATGDDANDGLTTATAWRTVTKLDTEMANAGVFGATSYATGDTVTIDTTAANLVLGQSSLLITTPGVNVVELGSGLAGPGEIQAWAPLPAGNWSGPVAGTTKVYQSAFGESNTGCVLWEDDKWMNHPTGSSFSTVQAALESTPGSFWTDGTTMYVHPFDDTNPGSDGKSYTCSEWRPGASGGGAAVQINAANVHLDGLRVRKTCLADQASNDPGGAYCYQTQGQLDGTMLVENCYAAYGSKHGFGYTDNSLTRQYTTRNCQCEQCTPYVAAGGQTCWVDYANNPGSNGTATSVYLQCTTLANSGRIGSTDGQYVSAYPVWISHNSGAGSLQFAEVDFTGCNFAGGLLTGLPAVVRFTGGSCRGASFSAPTTAYITNVLVPGGQPFFGSGTVIARNCVIAVDEINDGFEPATSGTLDYEGCTIDLRATTTNNDNHVLFSRAGTLNMTWRNNLVLDSTVYHFGVLRGATSTDVIAFDHNAYENVSTLVYGYDDGTSVADRTLTQWQALGQDAGSFSAADLMLDGDDFPALDAPEVDQGADIGPLTDYSGRFFNVRRTPGALEPWSTFARWQTQHFSAADLADPDVSGPGADPDGDGQSNLLEYALGTDPKVADTDAATSSAFQSIDGQSYLTLTYRQLKDTADLVYTPEASSDVIDWQSGTDTLALVDCADNGDGTETTMVRDVQPVGASPARFLRLQVSLAGTGQTGLSGRAKSRMMVPTKP